MLNVFLPWLVASVIAIALSSAYLLDGPDDTEAAQDVSDDYAQAVADGGKAKCNALGRDPLWTKEGDLVCRERVKVAGGVK